MESRSGHRRPGMRPPRCNPKPHPQPQCCPDGDGDGEGVDRISDLPDELLCEILRRLRCARAAARTCILSRRWCRGLWRGLPELFFHDVEARALPAALDAIARPELSLLDIYVRTTTHLSAVGITSLLRTVARLAPMELVVTAHLYHQYGFYIPIEVQLPCFHRAKSITLKLQHNFQILRVTSGDFSVLESLCLSSCDISISDLMSRAPRLRSLQLYKFAAEDTSEILVHSTTIEELLLCRCGPFFQVVTMDIVAPALKSLTLTLGLLRNIHVMAPVLKTFTLSARLSDHPSLSFSAPIVESLSWSCDFTHWIYGIWYLIQTRIVDERGGLRPDFVSASQAPHRTTT